MSTPVAKPWPRLSEAFKDARPDVCAQCKRDSTDLPLIIWQEHDEKDQPETRFVVLCQKCSDELIGPNVRLFTRLDPNAPAPGAMKLCTDCMARKVFFCPMAKANGGPGIAITASKPLTMHMDGRDKRGKRFGIWLKTYELPPSACTGQFLKPA